jgi:hypothetical protein
MGTNSFSSKTAGVSEIIATDINQFVNALTGAAQYPFAIFVNDSVDASVKLSEAAGARKFKVLDSAATEVWATDSDGDTYYRGTKNTTSGILKHEFGGLEFNASAITTGGLIKGDSAGVMEILAKGTAKQVLTMADDASDFAWAAVPVDLATVLDDFADSRALLIWTECSGMTPGAGSPYDFGGFHVNSGTTGAQVAVDDTANPDGGMYNIRAGTASGSVGHAAMCTNTKVVNYTRDPYFATKLTSHAATSEIQVQAWGFHESSTATDFDATNQDCAFFRQITTGNLFAVTGDGSSETTTDLGSVHTLGDNAVYEIVSSSNGGSYAFKINGTTRATHTGNLPNADMKVVAGIAKTAAATTAGLTIQQVDYLYATQDRT